MVEEQDCLFKKNGRVRQMSISMIIGASTCTLKDLTAVGSRQLVRLQNCFYWDLCLAGLSRREYTAKCITKCEVSAASDEYWLSPFRPCVSGASHIKVVL